MRTDITNLEEKQTIYEKDLNNIKVSRGSTNNKELNKLISIK